MSTDAAASIAQLAGELADELADDRPEAFAARLAGHHRRRRTLFDWMHPLRLADVPCAHRLTDCAAAHAAELAEAFLDAHGMPAPPLEAFGAPGAALALLPVSDCLAVFRLRALAGHAEPLRGWIDRPRRSLLTEWIGVRGVRLLFERGRDLAGDARSSATRAKPAPLDATDGNALAWLGYRLFERECRWTHDGPLAILQLAMPASADAEPLPARGFEQGANASLSIVSQLPDLFPEWSW